ncbi:MAG: hypothetical protein WB761_10695, partial [Solirubrobacteraceae bacterium]
MEAVPLATEPLDEAAAPADDKGLALRYAGGLDAALLAAEVTLSEAEDEDTADDPPPPPTNATAATTATP